MNIIKKITRRFTAGSQEAIEIKQEVKMRSENATKEWSEVQEEIKKLTAYKVAKSTGGL